MDFTNKIKTLVQRAENALDAHVPPAATRPDRLHAAMRYSLEAGGKRLRPVLVLATHARLTAGAPNAADQPTPDAAAAAIECLHTYSLIHDDLPCMDDDDLRRGRPTVHRAFDEATALLAGDALLTQAFALLAEAYAPHPGLAHALIRELADAAGSRRLIGGQMADLLAEKAQDRTTAEDLEFIHLNKTAAMIEAALALGGHVAGADAPVLATLRRAGRHLGLAFQIVDDVIDATSDTATLGKTAGKDARAGKTTYLSLHGLEVARARIATETAAAGTALAALPGNDPFLPDLARHLATRAS
jgi:geranylgeranyl diphosphate synthase, type II